MIDARAPPAPGCKGCTHLAGVADWPPGFCCCAAVSVTTCASAAAAAAAAAVPAAGFGALLVGVLVTGSAGGVASPGFEGCGGCLGEV